MFSFLFMTKQCNSESSVKLSFSRHLRNPFFLNQNHIMKTDVYYEEQIKIKRDIDILVRKCKIFENARS